MKSRLLLTLTLAIISLTSYSQRSSYLDDKIVFVCGNNPPYEIQNDKGEITGFNIDLIKEIMKRIESDYEIEVFNWNDALEYAKKHNRAVLIGMTYNDLQSNELIFSTPYEYISLGIMSNARNKYTSLRELENKSVIAVKGTYAERLISENKEQLNINPIIVNKVKEGVEMIHHKIADAFIVNSSMGYYAIKQSRYSLTINDMKDIAPLKYCMASTIDNDSLILQINNIISGMKSSGVYNVIYDRWIKKSSKVDNTPEWKEYAIMGGIAVLTIILLITIFIQRRIRKSSSKIETQNNEINKMNEQLSLIIKNTNSGYLYLSPNLDVIWESISQNKSFNYNTIYSHIGNKCYSLAEDTTMCKKCPVRKAIFTGMIQVNENQMGGMDIQQTAIPILDSEGVTKGIIVKVDDITQQKKITNELIRAKEKAEEADEIKTVFLKNMTHEIRTPLNSIIGFSSLIVDEENNEERHKYMEVIQYNSDMLISLIDGMLDMSSLEIGDVTIENMDFNINDLFTSVNSHLNSTFVLNPGVTFNIEKPLDMIMVNLDFRRTEQILLNYLTNASKYTDAGSITLGYAITENEIKFYVKDTGCGISKENIKKLFTSFQKLGSYKQGMGLGLSIAKTIAKAMGGRVDVDSVVGEGSTFWLIFPHSVISHVLEEIE